MFGPCNNCRIERERPPSNIPRSRALQLPYMTNFYAVRELIIVTQNPLSPYCGIHTKDKLDAGPQCAANALNQAACAGTSIGRRVERHDEADWHTLFFCGSIYDL